MTRNIKTCGSLSLLLLICAWTSASAQVKDTASEEKAPGTSVGGTAQKASADDAPTNVLTADEWQRVDKAVERALTWLAAQQRDDGSFPSLDTGQPAVTSLCIMAFISHGEAPGRGQYGLRLERATDYVLGCQKENGLLTKVGVDGPEIYRGLDVDLGNCTAYDHAISSLLLSELYGMSDPQRAKQMEGTIKKALAVTLKMQRWPKDRDVDKGGWRYIDRGDESGSDLSLTGWNLMFLRSAAMRASMCRRRRLTTPLRISGGAIRKSTARSSIGSTARTAAPAAWPAPVFWLSPMRATTIRSRQRARATGF